MFPDWNMKVFNLNQATESLPFAFREILTSLLESHRTIAEYTQPSILRMLERGINPTSVRPRRECVSVLYSDIIGFSRFAEHLAPRDLISLVNSHAEVCSTHVTSHNGQVNKLTGDGVLAYFPGLTSDDALDASLAILNEMARRREAASETSSHRYLYGGVGLSHGLVFEGNVGSALKRDFTILGNTVNLASRIESLTRDLNVRLNIDESVVLSAKRKHPFQSLGMHQLKGQSRAQELYTLSSLSPLNIAEVYQLIEEFVTRNLEHGQGERSPATP
jgi:class 3 adenylate cyclase